MPAKLKIENVDLSGKRVFMRVDFNVPQDKADPTKITKQNKTKQINKTTNRKGYQAKANQIS